MTDGSADRLAPLSLHVDGDVVNRYGVVAQDFNPIHFDDAAARALGLPKAIAHGMIGGALLSRFLAERLGHEWLCNSSLDIKFVRPTLVGQTLTATGVVSADDPNKVDVRVDNDNGQPIIVGVARLTRTDKDST